MPEPTTAAATLSLKLNMAIGSAIGSAISLIIAPARNHRDAAIKFAICFGFTMITAPIATRMVAKWAGASNESIPDLTLALAGVLGIGAWNLVAAIHKGIAKHSDRVAEEGLAAFLPRKKTP